MTIFTSSFARRVSAIWFVWVAVLMLGVVLLIWCFASASGDQSYVQADPDQAQKRDTLRSELQANFDRATQGMAPVSGGVVTMPRNNSAGLVCTPATLNRKSILRLVLPVDSMDRQGVLAALTPDGSLRIIYVSYGIDTDPEDLIVPSRAVDWKDVRSRNEFSIYAEKFDALREDTYVSEPLFQKPGIYQLALLNGTDRGLLEANGAAFWVIAGCIVRWQP